MRTDFTHTIIVSFNYGIDSLDPLHQLGDRLSYILDQSGDGFYDGHEIAMDDSDGSLFIYANNAENVYKLIEPVLMEVEWMSGASVFLQFGNQRDSAKSIEFILEKIQ
ncbi:MAG: hypothetical protein KDC80_13180 [Saprospiraceae bacterium]|nr:hypothetical protein [Saprospiraceae bacterium]